MYSCQLWHIHRHHVKDLPLRSKPEYVILIPEHGGRSTHTHNRCLSPLYRSGRLLRWIDDHDLSTCVVLVDSTTSTPAPRRRCITDPEIRARIERHLASRPASMVACCRICEVLVHPSDYQDLGFTVLDHESPDYVVYHMHAKRVASFLPFPSLPNPPNADTGRSSKKGTCYFETLGPVREVVGAG